MNKKVTDLKMIKAIFLLGIPLFLIIATGEVRPSISNYAYSDFPSFFVVLLTIAGTLFFDDGYIERKRFFNMVLGGALIGVALTPHFDFPVLHYSFAGLFFLGSEFNMIYFSSKKQRKYKILASIFIMFGLSGHFFFNWYSLLYAEWIGMLPISLHYIGESLGKID